MFTPYQFSKYAKASAGTQASKSDNKKRGKRKQGTRRQAQSGKVNWSRASCAAIVATEKHSTLGTCFMCL